jgi:D-alanyl-D-alanine carboxypeptidase
VVASEPTPAQAISTPAVPEMKPRVMAALTPTPRPALTPPAASVTGTAVAALTHPPVPHPRPNTVLASNMPVTLPAAKPSARSQAVGGDEMSVIKPATPARSMDAMARDWTIQIGAFNDATSAKAQLSAYAEHSMDVLGTAERIVVPFQAADGSKMFRARFGPFVEAEARQICAKLTQRGQTCFAAITN